MIRTLLYLLLILTLSADGLTCKRRTRRQAIATAFASFGLPPFAFAQLTNEASFLQGTVTVDESVLPQDLSALYITCRPDRADNVPAAILSGTRGKPPPILTARFANPTFPFDFQLGAMDLTVEGASEGDNYWWKNEDLIVSARWDSDGVAATRSPDDMVGRAYLKRADHLVSIVLMGRGAFGKFATGAGKK
jgi:hypothetical protein